MAQDPWLTDMLSTFRRTLHTVPERAHHEQKTVQIVESFLAACPPDAWVRGLGGHGLAVTYAGKEPGPTVLVRCELDALGCASEGTFAAEAAHRCGHDGHMAMVSGLAPLLSQNPPRCGRVILLYQPAEETGEGARLVIDDPQFPGLRPDYALALHNLPGIPEHTVVLRKGTFACASTGLVLKLQGVAGHAAEPELATSPAQVLALLLAELPKLGRPETQGLRMLTVTHAQLGTPSFGITPGHAQIYCTLRATTQPDLDALKQAVLDLTHRAVNRSEISVEVAWRDAFPATVSDDRLVERLAHQLAELGISSQKAEYPMRWSEDFGHFSEVCPTLYFGLGVGEAVPPLHHPGYEFPDPQIMTGVRVLHALIRDLLA